MIVNVLNQASNMTIRRTRKLSFPGQVLVNKGERVSPETIIAQGKLPGGILILDLARGLRLPPEEIRSCLARQIGDRVQAGDEIARCEGTFPRLVRAPVAGQLVECHQGNLVLVTAEMMTSLKAGMPGMVEKIIPEYGAIIVTWGCLVQGLWGNNRVGSGVLQVLESSTERPLGILDLELVSNGEIIVTGVCPSADVLDKMLAKGVSGVIAGVCHPDRIPALERIEVPVLILQGFGIDKIDVFTMAMLSAHEGKIATIDAHQRDAFFTNCPEVIIPLEKADYVEDAPLRGSLVIGQEVRIFSGPASGQTGIVSAISETQHTFPSGISDDATSVYLEDDQEVLVPSKNLMILNRGINQG
jgi:hypothetical protein